MTEVSIINLALARIGHTQFISDRTESSAEASLANEIFDTVRDELLTAYPWSFAMRRAALAEIDEETYTPPDEWGYAYGLPESCLRALRIQNGKVDRPSEKIEFVIESYDGGKALLCDDDAPTLVYIRKEPDVSQWTAAFGSALAWKLAAEFASGLKKDTRLADYCAQRASTATHEAAALDARQRHTIPLSSDIEAARA